MPPKTNTLNPLLKLYYPKNCTPARIMNKKNRILDEFQCKCYCSQKRICVWWALHLRYRLAFVCRLSLNANIVLFASNLFHAFVSFLVPIFTLNVSKSLIFLSRKYNFMPSSTDKIRRELLIFPFALQSFVFYCNDEQELNTKSTRIYALPCIHATFCVKLN